MERELGSATEARQVEALTNARLPQSIAEWDEAADARAAAWKLSPFYDNWRSIFPCPP